MEVLSKDEILRHEAAKQQLGVVKENAKNTVADAEDFVQRAKESADAMIAEAENVVAQTEPVVYDAEEVTEDEGEIVQTADGEAHAEKGHFVVTDPDERRFIISPDGLETYYQEHQEEEE